jgi:hypothetical protein
MRMLIVLASMFVAAAAAAQETPQAPLDAANRRGFVDAFVRECVRSATKLPRDKATRVCSCLANHFADSSTAAELAELAKAAGQPNSEILRAKFMSFRDQCVNN